MVNPNQTYGLTNPLQNVNPLTIVSQRAPTNQDRGHQIGTMWIDQPADDVYISTRAGIWALSSTGTSALDTLTPDTGTSPVVPTAGHTINILGGDTTTVTGSLNTLTINASTSGYPVTKYVVGQANEAGYQTIQSALDAANAEYLVTSIPVSVYVKPGTYTENLTFYDGVDLVAAGGQVDNAFTMVLGTHLLPATGTCGIYGIWFRGTTACFTAPIGGTTKVNMFNVITDITGVGYTFNIDGFSGELNIFDYLQFDTGTNGFVYNPTGGCEVNIIFAGVGLTRNLAATAQISGDSFFQGMLVSINMNFVGTSNTLIDMGCDLQGTISTADTASVTIENTYCRTDTGQAINHLSGGTVTLSNVTVNSSHITPIDGTGTIFLGTVAFLNSNTIAATLTLSSAPETRNIKMVCGDSNHRTTSLTSEYNTIQAFASTTDTIAFQINAMEGNMLVDAAASILQPTGMYGYCEQADGSAITSTAAGVEGHLNLLETDNADLPPVFAFAVKGYLDAADTTGIPAGMVAGVGSIVEYNTPFNAKAYGFVASRLDAGAGAGTAGQAAYGVLQGTVAAADWLYGIDLYNGGTGVAYTTADIRLWNQATIASSAAGITVTSVAGDDITFVLGDAAGATTFVIQDSTPSNVAFINSLGQGAMNALGLYGNLNLEAAGAGIEIAEGANCTMGVATLVAGTVTVNTTKATANSRIFLTPQGVLAGVVYISARVAGTSFTITSTAGADTASIAWLIIEPS